MKRILDLFDVGSFKQESYSESFRVSNIGGRSEKTWLGNPKSISKSMEALKNSFFVNWKFTNLPSVEDVNLTFISSGRTLLRETKIHDSGRVAKNTSAGAFLPSDWVLDQFKEMVVRRSAVNVAEKRRFMVLRRRLACPESAKDIQRLMQVAQTRGTLLNERSQSREQRCYRETERTLAKTLLTYDKERLAWTSILEKPMHSMFRHGFPGPQWMNFGPLIPLHLII